MDQIKCIILCPSFAQFTSLARTELQQGMKKGKKKHGQEGTLERVRQEEKTQKKRKQKNFPCNNFFPITIIFIIVACRLIYYNNDSTDTIYRKVLLVAAPIVCALSNGMRGKQTSKTIEQTQKKTKNKVSDLNLDFGVSNKKKSSCDRIERFHTATQVVPGITETTEWTSVEELMRITATGFDFLPALFAVNVH